MGPAFIPGLKKKYQHVSTGMLDKVLGLASLQLAKIADRNPDLAAQFKYTTRKGKINLIYVLKVSIGEYDAKQGILVGHSKHFFSTYKII